MELNPDQGMIDLLSLDLEYRLTIAHRIDCACAPYFIGRRDVLLPAILKKANEKGSDPVDVFDSFAQGVHARHSVQAFQTYSIDGDYE